MQSLSLKYTINYLYKGDNFFIIADFLETVYTHLTLIWLYN